ncbi:MAG: dihydropteroate synthase [Desulfomonile tiedjei]|uniref:Dihydropteroate synthase n=1 Tax=Desulfomonile tiedjei TaxID=2358 RepID=A0A9D6V7S7_9BACT|nr:dihydropteroate synthase [Desulfomonile tiedjei]
MIVIGEKINGTRKPVAKAIQERDAAFIRDLARRQFENGASYLDINAGTLPKREPEDMAWLVEHIQESVPDAILCLDSANPVALKAGIEKAAKTPMLNSLSGEKFRIDGVLPLACEFKTELIILALDDKGIPRTSEGRLAIVRNLIEMTRAGGLPDEKLFVDPLVMAISTGTGNGNISLETCRMIHEEFPRVHLTCGLSNISFGMPLRSVLNQAFIVLTIQAGMDSVIVNPEERELRAIMMAAETVLGMDRHCMNFNRAFRAGKIGPKATA